MPPNRAPDCMPLQDLANGIPLVGVADEFVRQRPKGHQGEEVAEEPDVVDPLPRDGGPHLQARRRSTSACCAGHRPGSAQRPIPRCRTSRPAGDGPGPAPHRPARRARGRPSPGPVSHRPRIRGGLCRSPSAPGTHGCCRSCLGRTRRALRGTSRGPPPRRRR